MSRELTGEESVYRLETSLSYDKERGVMSIMDDFIHQEIEVRKELEDRFLRQAVILELEKLGYTVISPEDAP